jgi:hypothetical protein
MELAAVSTAIRALSLSLALRDPSYQALRMLVSVSASGLRDDLFRPSRESGDVP